MDAPTTFASFVYPIKNWTLGLYYHEPLRNEGSGQVVPDRNPITGAVKTNVPNFYLPKNGQAPVSKADCEAMRRNTGDFFSCLEYTILPFLSALSVQERTFGVAGAYKIGKVSLGGTVRYHRFNEAAFTFRVTPTFDFSSISVQATSDVTDTNSKVKTQDMPVRFGIFDAVESQLRNNLNSVLERIAAAAERSGRGVDEVKLVAVSKTHPTYLIREAIAAGAVAAIVAIKRVTFVAEEDRRIAAGMESITAANNAAFAADGAGDFAALVSAAPEHPRIIREPRRVGNPFIGTRSLIVTGTPSSGPCGRPHRGEDRVEVDQVGALGLDDILKTAEGDRRAEGSDGAPHQVLPILPMDPFHAPLKPDDDVLMPLVTERSEQLPQVGTDPADGLLFVMNVQDLHWARRSA